MRKKAINEWVDGKEGVCSKEIVLNSFGNATKGLGLFIKYFKNIRKAKPRRKLKAK